MRGSRLVSKAKQLLSEKQIDYCQVAGLLERARKLQHPEAMYALGTWYFHGEYFKKDIKKGFVLMLEAADLNFSDACFDVAVAYEKGRGVKKNVNKAFEYYFRALILEDKQAIFEVGRCYFYGIGIPKNKKMADVIITIARNQYGLE